MMSPIFANIFRTILMTLIWFVLLFIAYAMGRRIITWIRIEDQNQLDKVVFAIPMGLGVISFGFFLLGVVGLFQLERGCCNWGSESGLAIEP